MLAVGHELVIVNANALECIKECVDRTVSCSGNGNVVAFNVVHSDCSCECNLVAVFVVELMLKEIVFLLVVDVVVLKYFVQLF